MDKDNKQFERRKHADTIIKNHAIWSMGAGFIPVPIVDLFAVTAVQLDMIRQISKVYDLDFKETQGKAVITALTGSSLARLGARAVKFIPGVGSLIGGATLAVLSGASTFAIGEVFKKHFETGGTFLDFDLGRLKHLYDEKFEKGKEYARKWQKEAKKKKDKDPAASNGNSAGSADAHVVDIGESLTDPKAASKSSPGLQHIEHLYDLKVRGAISEAEFEILKKNWLDNELTTK
jgi:uncharacterized protein (DUF697 family)